MDKITLYHYTDKKIKDKIKPHYFGNNNHTFNDVKISKVRRTFFYLDNSKIEYRFKNCKYCYKGFIDKKKLYNLNKDPKKLKGRFKSIDDLLKHVKSRYDGVIYSIGDLKIANVFKSVKIYEGKKS